MPLRKRTRAQRTQSKQRKAVEQRRVLEHQRAIDGSFPVYEQHLQKHLMDGALYPVSVYMAPAEPLVQGFNKHSQTAIVMQALERYGAENARL